MPGTKFPDALLVIPAFPPSKTIIQALLDCGFYFRLGFPLLRIFFISFDCKLNFTLSFLYSGLCFSVGLSLL
jgi:hypothetical protein